jgi:hypothetical protein
MARTMRLVLVSSGRYWLLSSRSEEVTKPLYGLYISNFTQAGSPWTLFQLFLVPTISPRRLRLLNYLAEVT